MLDFSLMAMALPGRAATSGSCYCPKAGHINRETKNVNGHVLVELKNGVDTCANYNAEVEVRNSSLRSLKKTYDQSLQLI